MAHPTLPRNDVKVPAGRFARAVRVANPIDGSPAWFHPEVPITGMVKRNAGDGTTIELVSYGDTGATSPIEDIEDLDSYVLCKEREATGTHIGRPRCLRKTRYATYGWYFSAPLVGQQRALSQ